MIRVLQKSVLRSHQQDASITCLSPSELVENFFYLPVAGEVQKFSLENYPFWYAPYDLKDPRILMMTGRQVFKSTFLGNRLLAFCSLIPHFRALYVSPTNTQTTMFSNDRIRATILNSPWLRAMEDKQHVDKILHKAFYSRAELVMRYAFLTADRIRGLAMDMIAVDEIQDILYTLLPVIEETLSNSTYKWRFFSGTPLTESNTLHILWSQSTQNEWLIPCDRCGSKAKTAAGRFYNLIGERNIGKRGIICAKCGKRIHARHLDALWVAMNPHPRGPKGDPLLLPFQGFHISQLLKILTPSDWLELLNKYETYERYRFFNEVLGYAYDAGTVPITRDQLRANCNSQITMSEESVDGCPMNLAYFESLISMGHPCYMGID